MAYNKDMHEDKKSSKSFARGYIVRENCINPSNFRSESTLDAFLKRNNIEGYVE